MKTIFGKVAAWMYPVEGHPHRNTRMYLLLATVISLTTWCLKLLEVATHEDRPFCLFYLVPVAFFGAVMGLRGGLVAATLACVVARFFLFHFSGLQFVTTGNFIEFIACLISTFSVGTFTGIIQARNAELRQSELTRGAFFQDVMRSVTHGRFLLVPDSREMMKLIDKNPCITVDLITPADASSLRRQVVERVSAWNPLVRLDDLSTCLTEAATNTVKHGGGGFAKVFLSDDLGDVEVLLVDQGVGISADSIAKATLEAGYSTKSTLGVGFTMMLATADKIALCTGAHGTQILLKVGCGPPPKTTAALFDADDILASFPAL